MALVDDIAKACAHRPRVARWAPEISAAAELHQVPELGLPAAELALDVAAIISRETRGENILGDGGSGHGLMQIDSRFHAAWLAVNANGLDPASNVSFGTALYVSNFQEITSHEAQCGRSHSVQNLRRYAMAAFNVGLSKPNGHGVLDMLDAGGDPDAHTTPGPTGKPDYGADVWRRCEAFAAQLGAGVCA